MVDIATDPLSGVKDMRKRIVAGEDVTDAELKEAILALHNYRNESASSSKKASTAKQVDSTAKAKVTKTASTKIDLSDLLG